MFRQIPLFLFFEPHIFSNHVPFLMANPGYQVQEKSTPHFLGAKIRIPSFVVNFPFFLVDSLASHLSA